LHDKVGNPSAIKLTSKWNEIGVCPLTYVEIMLEAENEFYIELADEDLERFVTVNDAVEHISRSFFTN
jgi:acyl carrier protein